MRLAKNISFYIVIGFLLAVISNYLKSEYLFKYLKENIIGLLLTLLAINTATLGLIASKIQDILKDYKMDFSKTIKEMKFSLYEQVALISISILTLIFLDSELIEFQSKSLALKTILNGVLIYSISILLDTGKSVFVIIDLIQKNKK